MNESNFFQSSDFRRVSTQTADSGVKLFFKYVGIGFKAIIDFVTTMFSQVFGK